MFDGPETTEPDGQNPGGQGDGLRLSRSDVGLLRKAARAQWGVPDPVQTEAVFQLARILADTKAKRRDKIAAARTLAALTRCDQVDERLALDRARGSSEQGISDAKALRDFLSDGPGTAGEGGEAGPGLRPDGG